MVEEAPREAARRGRTNTTWVGCAPRILAGGLAIFRVAISAPSFHWLDRARVAATVRVAPDGRFAERAREIAIDVWTRPAGTS